MKIQKIYEAGDKMISLIKDNYNLLQSLGSFGINLGFGDKTVDETCKDNGVDTYTFLAVVNYTINGHGNFEEDAQLSVPTLLHYLKASHVYFLGFQLPFIRRELQESIDESSKLGGLILKLYDDYAQEIHEHMMYEERMLFPYVDALLGGKVTDGYSVDVFIRKHSDANAHLKEIKTLIIKYLPGDTERNNKLMAALHDIYNNEEWLALHCQVEENVFAPAVRRMEQYVRQSDVSRNISKMMMQGGSDNGEALSDRERDVVISLVQGMSNKEIADHLCISTNTVLTHRRNIARKLQIRSAAGLTIYAIVNGLVTLNDV